MSNPTFLISSSELAAHTQEKQQLVFDMLQAAHETYPELNVLQLLEYTKQWVDSVKEETETWDYTTELAAMLSAATAEEDETPVETEAIEIVTTGEEEQDDEGLPETEFLTVDDTADGDGATPVENIIEDEPGDAAPVETEDDTPLQLDDTVEESETEDEDEEIDFFENAGASSTVSRQKKWRGLLAEAAKLDH